MLMQNDLERMVEFEYGPPLDALDGQGGEGIG
jgi:hypothetical protein